MAESPKAEYLAYYTSKLSHFIEDRMLRNILGQRRGLDFGQLLRVGGALLANLSRGKLGDLNSRLLGMILLHQLERATLERSLQTPGERRPYHIYIDEFQELTTTSLETFLTAARKFHVGLTLAHQRLDTLPLKTQELILGTVGNVVLFRQGSSDGLKALPALLWPRFGERELLVLPNFQALARVSAEDGTPRLGRLRIPPPPPATGNARVRIQELSRRRFGRARRVVEAELHQRFGVGEGSTS